MSENFETSGQKSKKRTHIPVEGYTFEELRAKAIDELVTIANEFHVENPQDYKVGQAIELSVLDDVEKVDVTGHSVGKGFQGTVKRWNFGRGPMGHGSKNHREPGSIGAGTTPSRVIKGKKMAGNMGNEQVTVAKLKLVKVDSENSLVLVKGSVPGPEGKLVTIKPSRIKWN